MAESARKRGSTPELELARALDGILDEFFVGDRCRYRGDRPFVRSPRAFARRVLETCETFPFSEKTKAEIDGAFEALRLLIVDTPLTQLDGDALVSFLEDQTGARLQVERPSAPPASVRREKAKPYVEGMAFHPGDVVDHPRFGLGDVCRVGEGKVEVAFADGVRRLSSFPPPR